MIIPYCSIRHLYFAHVYNATIPIVSADLLFNFALNILIGLHYGSPTIGNTQGLLNHDGQLKDRRQVCKIVDHDSAF